MAQIASTPSSIRRFRRWSIAMAALAGLLLAASASAPAQDLRSPDARAVAAVPAEPATQGPGAPEASDTANQAAYPGTQDLRSPDARETGGFVSSPQDTSTSSSSDWVYLAIGGLLSLALIGSSVLLVQRHRRHALATGSS
jgi:hypothetical protein